MSSWRETYRVNPNGTGSRQPLYQDAATHHGVRTHATTIDRYHGSFQPHSSTVDRPTSASTYQSDHDSFGPRSPSSAKEHRMEVDETPDSGRGSMPLPSTQTLFSTLQSLPEVIAKSKEEIKALKRSVSAQSPEDIDRLHGDLEKLKLENQRLEEQYKDLSANKSDADKIHKLEEELKKTRENKDSYRKKCNDIALQYKTKHDRVEELEEKARQHETDMDKFSREWESLSLQLSRKQTLYENTEKKKKEIESELSETKTRLSRLMGNKLANNNPDIADLSDKNRPTKLAEKYTELYDNQWTDAFEVFEEHFQNERKSIRTLIQVLMDIKTHCEKLTTDQELRLHEAVVLKRTRDRSLPEHVSKQLKDFRKSIAEITLPEVQEKCLSEVKYKEYATFLKDGRIQPFVKGCIELCWLMSVQDPTLVFGEAPVNMDAFDTNTYKHYTRTGPFIEFIVWPALYLHKGGPLLSKGVAQGYGKHQNSSAKQRAREIPSTNITMPDNYNAESEPPGQTMDRHTPKLKTVEQNEDRGYQGNFSSSHKQNGQNQNYEQTVIGGTSVTPEHVKTFSRTTKEHESTSVAERLNTNAFASQRENVSKTRLFRPRPDTLSWETFNSLRRMYGIDSTEIKNGLGAKYNDCREYHDFIHKKKLFR